MALKPQESLPMSKIMSKQTKPKKIIVTDISAEIEKNADKLKAAANTTPLKEKLKTILGKKDKNDDTDCKPTVWMLTFNGDTTASDVTDLSNAISAVIKAKKDDDKVVVNINSGGGTVNGYGLVAAELLRIKNAGIHLTACIDLVAASGGYLAACVADEVIAAPFSYIGSIGVVGGMPNFHRLLEKHGIEYVQETAGESKRDVTPFTEVKEEDRAELRKRLESIHVDFIEHVKKHRAIDVDDDELKKVFNGDYWLAQRTVQDGLNLIDKLMLSSELIEELSADYKILKVSFEQPKEKKSLIKRIIGAAAQATIETIDESALEQKLKL